MDICIGIIRTLYYNTYLPHYNNTTLGMTGAAYVILLCGFECTGNTSSLVLYTYLLCATYMRVPIYTYGPLFFSSSAHNVWEKKKKKRYENDIFGAIIAQLSPLKTIASTIKSANISHTAGFYCGGVCAFYVKQFWPSLRVFFFSFFFFLLIAGLILSTPSLLSFPAAVRGRMH